MIVTIFGDVHGNLIALEKLFDLETHKTDLFVCHGDVVNYGPWTNECIQFLNNVDNCKYLKGNHENYFIKGLYDGQNIVAKAFFNFCYESFNENLIPIIHSYDEYYSIGDFKITHTINNQYVYLDTDISMLKINSNYIIGHSHQQFEREYNKFKIYNTGSIGQNREYINKSCYIQIDTISNKVELKSFTYDINRLINQMKHDNYPRICLDYYLFKKQIRN